MSEKTDIHVGDKVLIQRLENGWSAAVGHAGGALSGRPFKVYPTLQAIVDDLRGLYEVE